LLIESNSWARPSSISQPEDINHRSTISNQKEEFMCPECIANAALVAGSVISTGGIGALVAKLFRSKKSGRNNNPKANSGKEK
jgi:hypothetical protein